MAFLVGVGITLLSVIVPARRAAKIPPVAAMRPELGFEALSTRRLVVGTVVTVVGAVAFIVGLFVRPGGTVGTLGARRRRRAAASSSAWPASRPRSPDRSPRLIGWPIAKLFKTPGVLARENAGRAPRRTSATAAALMIGVVAGQRRGGVRLVDALDVRRRARALAEGRLHRHRRVVPGAPADGRHGAGPGPRAVGGHRRARRPGPGRRRRQKAIGAVDPLAFEQLVDIGLQDGSFQAMADGGIIVQQDPAKDLDLAVGRRGRS